MIAKTVRLQTLCALRRRISTCGWIASLAVWAGYWAVIAQADIQPVGRMLRYPDVSKTHIVFSYANDLWLVLREGGQASPLTSPAGLEESPRFSPDGQTLAFVGNYDGGRDIYTLAIAGGIPQRMTHHPADEMLCDWTPDGALVFSTNGFAGLARVQQLYRVSAQEPLPTRLPVAYGTNGAISPDGVYLAFTPYSRDTRTWKRYRGGMASDIWLFHLEQKTAQRITDWEGTDSFPMWHGKTLYYLSDAGPEHRLNIWAYDTETGARRQVTDLRDFDVKWPAIGPGDRDQGEIVFQYASDLYLLDLESGASRVVEVTIPGDRPQIMPRTINAADFITSGDISPGGERIVVEARGDIWSLPAKNGSPRNMTRTSGVAERDPSWSPDGRWIAYLADHSGEYELYIQQSDGKGETRRLTHDGQVFRYTPAWSPDSKHILFTDKTGAVYLHTIDGGATVLVDRDPWATRPTLSWSHDASWIAYTKRTDDRAGTASIWLYEVRTGTKHAVTDGMFNDSWPAFDRKGEYLFFSSNRSFGSPVYEDLGTTFIYSNTEVLVALPLRKDVKNPLLPKSDEVAISDPSAEKPADKKDEPSQEPAEESEGKPEEKPAEEKEDEPDDQPPPDAPPPSQDSPAPDEKPAEEPQPEPAASAPAADGEQAPPQEPPPKKEEPTSLQIELDGILQRAFRLPVKNGVFSQLCVNARGHLIYTRGSARGSEEKPSIVLFDLTDEAKSEKPVFPGAGQFTISADGKKLLVVQERRWFVVDASAGAKPQAVSTNGMQSVLEPREEWQQLFVDAWRIQRDFFYDPHMHGIDWPAMRNQYEKMLIDCTSREDVGYVIAEMISELNVGHAYYRGGDVEKEQRQPGGVLGCEFAREQEAYRIARFYEGAPWDLDARNPLREAGVQPGDFLLAVNRVPLRLDRDPWAPLQRLAGQTVVLTVSSQPQTGPEDRDVVVTLPASDQELRYRQWIEQNRKHVDEKTHGRVGYIYVPDTGVTGQNDLFRQFYGQRQKDALIIDDRWNGGGQIPTRFIELLNRPVTNYWARRDGHDMTWPPDAHHGPKCMLINGLAGSGGDMFPALFRQNRLGKLIGTRTWGGLVGISGNPGLIDGASVTVPTFAYYKKDGRWGIEGHGVDPDIEVVDDPGKRAQGIDPQLEAAIRHMLRQLERRPHVPPARPAYPNRSGFGIDPQDK